MGEPSSVLEVCLLLAASQPGSALAVPADRPVVYAVSAREVARVGPRLAARFRRDQGPTQVWVEGASPAQVRVAGGLVRAEHGPFVVARIDRDGAHRLAREGAYLDAPPRLRPALDRARVQIGADRADFGEGFLSRYRGSGVLIGIYDSGLDLHHPDFFRLDGPTRAVAVWDQDDPTGPPPVGSSTGTACGREVLARRACAATDPTGHGTHALAVAASSGPRHRGVAPDAGLVVARSDRLEQPIEALAWMTGVARALGRPMVIDFSLVTQEGPHDGTSALARAIDATPHLVALAAGNDGQVPLHAQLDLEPTQTRRLVLEIPPAPGPRAAVVELWGLRPVEARIRMFDGPRMIAESGAIRAGQPGRTEALLAGSATVAFAELDAPGPNPHNGKFVVRLELRWTSFDVALDVSGDGRVDAWVEPGEGEPSLLRFASTDVLPGPIRVGGDTEHTLSDPATAASGVAVSGVVSRSSLDGQTPLGEQGRILASTSFGPSLAEGSTKPELSAPGGWVIAARARPSGDGPLYEAAAGTSVSAPMVAGAAALLLEAEPGLDVGALRQHLIGSAKPPSDADPRWGAGQIDVAAALARVAPTSGCSHTGSHPSASMPSRLAPLALLALLARSRRRRRKTHRTSPECPRWMYEGVDSPLERLDERWMDGPSDLEDVRAVHG